MGMSNHRKEKKSEECYEKNEWGWIITVTLSLWIKGRNLTQTFYVINLGGQDNIILRYPWLTKNNPRINWEKGEVEMPGTPVPRHDNPEVMEQRYVSAQISRSMSDWETQLCCHTLSTMKTKRAWNTSPRSQPSSYLKTHPLHFSYSSCSKGQTKTPITICQVH